MGGQKEVDVAHHQVPHGHVVVLERDLSDVLMGFQQVRWSRLIGSAHDVLDVPRCRDAGCCKQQHAEAEGCQYASHGPRGCDADLELVVRLDYIQLGASGIEGSHAKAGF